MKKLFILLFAYTIPFMVSAQAYVNPIATTWAGVDTIPKFLIKLVDLAFLIMMPMVVLFLVYAGFKFVTAGDNDRNRESARSIFLWTVVGAGVIIAAKVLSAVIQATILSLT